MTYILPSQFRTIYVIENIGIKTNVHKFQLLIPDLEFTIKKEFEKKQYICKLIKEKKQHYVPLLNVNIYNQICIGDNYEPNNEKELASQFFNSYFTFDIKSSLYRIIYNYEIGNDDSHKDYLKFFAEWQKTGEFKFVKYDVN